MDVLNHKRSIILKPLISYNENITVTELLSNFKDNNIISCPIYRDTADNQKLYIAIISIYDIMSFAVFNQIFHQNPFSIEDYYANQHSVKSEFFNLPVKAMINEQSTVPWIFYASDKLQNLIDALSNNIRKVLVIDSEVLSRTVDGVVPPDVATNIVSDVDVVRFLSDCSVGKIDLLPSASKVFNLTVEAMNSVVKPLRKPVIAMLDTQSAIHGFRTLYMDKLQGIPVIDDKGNIVANLSVTDFRGLTVDNMDSITKPVYEYLQSFSHKNQKITADQLKTVQNEDTVLEAVSIMLGSGIHRVWIVEGTDKLVGAFSVTDILKYFAKEQL